jgi:hypothetical protein
MEKLKIYSNELTLTNIVEEQLLYLGKVSDEIIKLNKTFRNISSAEIINLIEYTNPNNCDFILYPQKINPNENIDDLIEISKKFNKKILLFYNDDNDKIFNFENSIIFRTSLYRTIKPKNYFSVPAFCNDLKLETSHYFRNKTVVPTIGFCGAITHEYRRKIIDSIKDSEKLVSNFIIRNDFWGGKIWDDSIRIEYIQNSLMSDFIICVRGAGNFSYRFYETLCLGRIPIVLDTDISLPFESYLNYDFILKIKTSDLSNLESIILNYWQNIEDYLLLQKQIISFWENHLSPLGFIKTLNKYKNEINNLLH